METVKYKTTVRGSSVQIPEHILEQLGRPDEVEVVFRPIRRASSSNSKTNQVIEKIERQMDEEFPNLKGSIGKELADLAGTSCGIKEDMRKYTDKEIVGMARMEKYIPD
jgi:hypothetical protein